MKKNNLFVVLFFVLFGTALIYFMAIYVVPRILVTLTKAAPASSVSIENSYFIGGKLLAKSDGKDNCIVNVFALDASGKGVKGKTVVVTGVLDEEMSEVTDSDGKATFKVISDSDVQYKLTATIEGVKLGQDIAITFRN